MRDMNDTFILTYYKDEVFKAMLGAIDDNHSIKLNSEDVSSGIINISVGVSLFSWGEELNINVVERQDANTEVTIASDRALIDKNNKSTRCVNELKRDVMFLLRYIV